MIVTVQIDTAQPLSEADRDLLAVLSDFSSDTANAFTPAPAGTVVTRKTAAKAPAKAPAQESTEPMEDEPAPAKAPAKRAAKKAAAKPEPEPEDEDEANEEDLKAIALEKASALLAAGEREKVTSALAAAGVARVGAVPAADLPAFIEALDA